MSKSERKQAQKQALKNARLHRLNEIQNPSLPPDDLAAFRQTCDEMYGILDDIARDASVTRKLSFDEPAPQSHSGGNMLLKDDDDWPVASNGPLAGVLEIFTDELPYVPRQLSECKLLQVFIDLENGEDRPAYRDGECVVMLHENLNSLTPHSVGVKLDQQFLAFAHESSTPTCPGDLDIVDRGVLERFEDLPNWGELLAARYPSAGGIRIGGWPQWIDGQGVGGDFVFQIEGWFLSLDFGFDGTLYFGLASSDSTWHYTLEIG